MRIISLKLITKKIKVMKKVKYFVEFFEEREKQENVSSQIEIGTELQIGDDVYYNGLEKEWSGVVVGRFFNINENKIVYYVEC